MQTRLNETTTKLEAEQKAKGDIERERAELERKLKGVAEEADRNRVKLEVKEMQLEQASKERE